MLRRLYDWTMGLAAHPHALFWLAVLTFAESSFFPIPPEALLVPMILSELLLGISIGFVVNMVYYTFMTGTEMMSTQIGMAAAKQFNPSLATTQSPTGGIVVLLSLTVFLGMNL